MRPSLALVLLVSACGGGGSSLPPDAGPHDAAPDSRPADAAKPDAEFFFFDAAPDARFVGDGGGTGRGTVTQETLTSPLGTRAYRLFSPTLATPEPRPLVIALHPCSSTGDDFAATTEYEKLAAFDGFFVAFPDQDPDAEPFRCWRWNQPANQQRGLGEPGLIAGITLQIVTTHSIDPARIYVIGMGNGGAMAITMAATYPDLYAAAGSVGGCAYQGTPCVPSAPTATGDALGQLVHDAQGPRARVLPVFVLQGDLDPSVSPANAVAIVGQWLRAADLADGNPLGSVPTTPASTDSGTAAGGETYGVEHYLDRNGASLIDNWVVHGLMNFWPGGPAGATFTDPLGPPATDASWTFFRAHPMR